MLCLAKMCLKIALGSVVVVTGLVLLPAARGHPLDIGQFLVVLVAQFSGLFLGFCAVVAAVLGDQEPRTSLWLDGTLYAYRK